MNDGAATRRRLLAEIYGREASEPIATGVEMRLAGCRSTAPVDGWDQRDAWLISYPDQVSERGSSPLAALRSLVNGHLRPWLNGVHVLPFHPSSSDWGFSVTDYGVVDPAYGGWGDLHALAGDGRLMVDAVINHMSASGAWFLRFLDGDPEFAGFFRTAAPDADLTQVVRPRTHPLLTRFEGANAPVWVWTTFSADQVDLDFGTPRVLLRVLDVLLSYVANGAQVIRLDAIAFLWKQEGTPSIHLPQTHRVIQFYRSCLDEVDPGIVLVTETNVPHAENISYFGDGATREAQAVYQFPLAPLVLDAFLHGDASTLARWAADLQWDVPGTTFLNFLASHDGVGVRPAEGLLPPERVAGLVRAAREAGGRISERSLPDGTAVPYELNSTWFDLMAAGHGPKAGLARHLASHAVMLALRGIPLLYVHSLFGSDNDHAGFAATAENRALNRARFVADDLEAALADSTSRSATVWAALRRMLEWRASSAAFHPDSRQRILDAPPQIIAIERVAADGSTARVLVNVADGAVTAPSLGGAGWVDMASGAPAPPDVPVGPWASVWLAGS